MNNCNRICQVFTGAILTFKFYNHIFLKKQEIFIRKNHFFLSENFNYKFNRKDRNPFGFHDVCDNKS